MAGGPDDGVRQASSRCCSRLGRNITHVGGNGQGLLLKLAINISLATQMLAFSEGLLLAERGGIDPRTGRQGDGRVPDRVTDAAGTRCPSSSTCPTRHGSMCG